MNNSPENVSHLDEWTLPSNYIGEFHPNSYGSGCCRNRDSDCLSESNFHSMLDLLGGESDTVEVIREGHCLVGWVEWIKISGDDDTALTIANEAQKRLEDYPVLSEWDLVDREVEKADEVLSNCYDDKERLEYIRENSGHIEFTSWADLRSVVRGEYFTGNASELIG